jgi:hypothetical protein
VGKLMRSVSIAARASTSSEGTTKRSA